MASFFEHIGSEVESVADAAALASKIAAEAAQVAAEASANAAASSASDASNSEASVTASITASAASAAAALVSETNATTKASEAAASATTSTTKASESAASAATATSQASTATTQASTSTSQAAISTTKAAETAASAANAATSATSADTAKTAAEQAETNAETAETNAASSASSASTSASNASTSATAASGSASAASTSEANTASSASAAATSATNAATSATNSASSATSASNSAATATTQATTATTKATESAASQATSTAQAAISTTKASEAAASAATATTKASEAAASAASTNALIDPTVLKVDGTNNRVGINDTTPSVSLDAGSNTDAIAVPVGTTAQRPADGAGRFRYNSTTQAFEGYTTEWGSIAGGGGTNTFTTDSFTANGSTTAYALSQVVSSEGSLLVFIDGVFQTQDAYSIATASGATTLTFSAAPANGRKIVVYSVAAAVSGSNLNIDSMTGDGSDVTLTLSIAPVNVNNTIVTIDGVYQAKANYSISGTTLTFSTAPPTGSAVEVMTFTQTDINVPVDGTVTSAKLSGDLTTPGALTVTGTATATKLVSTNGVLELDDNGSHNGVINVPASLFINIDSDNGATGEDFVIAKDRSSTSGGTELFRVQEDGRVGIGVSNPSDYYAANLVVGAGSEGGITIASTSSANNGYLMFADSSSGIARYAGLISYEHSTDNMVFRTNSLERMRLHADGHLILSNNAAYIQVAGPSGSAWAFGSTGGTNAPGTAATGMGWHRWNGSSWLSNMYLGPNGILGVFGSGTTSPRGDITMTTGTSDSSKRWGFGGGATGNNAVFYVINEGNVGVYMSHGGQSWVAHSDERIKENIADVGTVLPSLMNMRCVKYNLISNPSDTKIGFIAQDWESAFPEVVDENEHLVLEADGTVGTDDDSDSTTPVKAMAYTETIPLLLKGIQELKEELNAATARITELENN